MTAAATPAGAVSRNTVDWHAINWHNAHTIVRRLQARIVQATQMGRWGKVQALQRRLTHAFSAKVLAVKRVTENQGKREGVSELLIPSQMRSPNSSRLMKRPITKSCMVVVLEKHP